MLADFDTTSDARSKNKNNNGVNKNKKSFARKGSFSEN
jgi:hypothetical protein